MKFVLLPFLLIAFLGHSQDPSRFKEEVADIEKKYDSLWDPSQETIVFTGSSSIRTWDDLEEKLPNSQIVNTGFGGSQASDLLAYSKELILKYNPKKVFIYEGDNDISAHKKSKEIITTVKSIIDKIKANTYAEMVIIIAAKPSIVRWHLKRKYKRLNRKFKRLCKKDNLLEFADIWKPMLHRRKLKQDIYIKDGLHMNAKGYELWYPVIKQFIN